MNKSEKFARKIVYYTNLYQTGSVHPIFVDRYDSDNGLFRGKLLKTEEVYCEVAGSSLELRKALSRKKEWYVFTVSFREESGVVHKRDFDIVL